MSKFITIAILAAALAGLLAGCGGRMIYEENFEDGIRDWYVEGGRSVAVADGRLVIDADPPEVSRDVATGLACTVWNRRRIDGDARYEFDVTVLDSKTGTNNINFFFCYTMPDGASPEATTADRPYGDYQAYHHIPGYICTFLNAPENREAARVRIRRCPGFRLLTETYAYHNRRGETYRIAIEKRGGAISFYVDGQLLLAADDASPLDGGYFGFRTFRTKLAVDRLTVRKL